MRIVVCIKQVPVVSAMAIDPVTRTLKREGVRNEVNPFDVRALVKALELRDLHGGEVMVMTMGPPQAREALTDCLALGADRAVHLCDRAFAGADTLATARALAHALRREAPDVILCGRNSVDAETGQVGPEIAELLDMPQITGARSLTVDGAARRLTAERETDDGCETLSAPLPALLTAAEDLAPERFPSKAGREAAAAKPCETLRAADLSADASEFGVVGSPTEVIGLEPLEATRRGRVLEAETVDAAAAQLARLLIEEHGLFGRWRVGEQPLLATIAAAPLRTAAREVWVLAEQLDGAVRPVVFELLGKARQLAHALASRVTAVFLGRGVEPHAAALAAHGADRILAADDARLAPFLTEVHAEALAAAIRTHAPGIVLIPATSVGRDLAPRVAARLQLGLTADCIDIGLDAHGRLLQYKPAFGGSIVAPIVSRTVPEMATVRPGMLRRPAPDATRPVVVEPLGPAVGVGSAGPLPNGSLPSSKSDRPLGIDLAAAPRTTVIGRLPAARTAVELDTAEVVIGVGMGLGDPTNLAAIQPLAELLGAALCTTRDVCDKGWLPKQHQVGLTGRAIAPKLYIAVGIRGAFEHLVGVRRAGVIVAINKSARAPVFKGADYGIVGDYAEVVPAVHRHLSAARTQAS
jgi:electron transfer flavoprotein alpha subunit